jgi:hypothetical protein
MIVAIHLHHIIVAITIAATPTAFSRQVDIDTASLIMTVEVEHQQEEEEEEEEEEEAGDIKQIYEGKKIFSNRLLTLLPLHWPKKLSTKVRRV